MTRKTNISVLHIGATVIGGQHIFLRFGLHAGTFILDNKCRLYWSSRILNLNFLGLLNMQTTKQFCSHGRNSGRAKRASEPLVLCELCGCESYPTYESWFWGKEPNLFSKKIRSTKYKHTVVVISYWTLGWTWTNVCANISDTWARHASEILQG